MGTARRALPWLLLAVCGAAGALLLFRLRGGDREAEDPIPGLKERVAREERDGAAAVLEYSPKTRGRIDDLGVSAQAILAQLPNVARVEVLVRVEKPTARIVHIADWHFVPRDLYAIDLRSALGREVSDREVEQLHRKLLLEVELVQLEQSVLLRCLVRHHGLKNVFCEGLTNKDLESFQVRMDALREMEKGQPELLRQKREVEEMLADLAARKQEASERYHKASAIAHEIGELLEQRRSLLLEVGVSGRLLLAGEIEQVLPLDDAERLDAARPVTPDGRVHLDKENLRARQDAQVKAVLDRGPFGLIVLGGAHDLSDSVRSLSGGRCEYIRVSTRSFLEFGTGNSPPRVDSSAPASGK